MDSNFLKFFLPEIFFSTSILIQLLFNTNFINKLELNYPIIYKETVVQTFFILICLLFLFLNNDLFGYFANSVLSGDSSTSILKAVVVFLSLLVLLLIVSSLLVEQINFFEYFTLYLISIFSLLLLINASDLLSAYLIIEMQALCFYVLASFKRNSSFSTEAGLKYFISGSFISGIFLLGAVIIYGSVGSLQFSTLFLLLSIPFSIDFNTISSFLQIGVFLITVTLLFKIAAAPFHFWAPDVYEGSPLASTIIFSIIPKISIFIFFIRWSFISSYFFLSLNSLLIFISLLSIFFGTFLAIKQKRIKRFIIYSSLAQISFLVVPFSTLTIDGFSHLLFFLFNYLLTSVLVWGNLILFYRSFNVFKTYLQNRLTTIFISNVVGFSTVNKITAASFILIFFSISGIPPFSGFLTKISIFLILLESKQFFPAILLILFNVISVYYYIRIIKMIFFEVNLLNLNNLKFQMTYSIYLYQTLNSLFAILLFILIFIFFNPNLFYLFSQYCILAIENY